MYAFIYIYEKKHHDWRVIKWGRTAQQPTGHPVCSSVTSDVLPSVSKRRWLSLWGSVVSQSLKTWWVRGSWGGKNLLEDTLSPWPVRSLHWARLVLEDRNPPGWRRLVPLVDKWTPQRPEGWTSSAASGAVVFPRRINMDKSQASNKPVHPQW